MWQEKILLFLRSTGRSDYRLLDFIKPNLSTFEELSYLVRKASLSFLVQTGDAWRKPNEALNIKNIRPTIKHGGSSVMVCGCLSALGVGKVMFIDGIMDKHVYLSILKEHLHASAKKMGLSRNEYYFQQDNDPKHTALDVKLWI